MQQTCQDRRARPRCPWEAAGPGCDARGRQRHHRQPNFARNLTRSFFETTRKRCNSNDMNSKLELIAGELRATLLGNHSGISNGGPTGVEGAGGAGGPGRASRRGAEGTGGQATAPECPEDARGPGHGARGRRRGQGGPRDRPLRAAGSRVAISRAGRRPRAHQAAWPHGRALRRPAARGATSIPAPARKR